MKVLVDEQLREQMDENIRGTQNEFRKGRSCAPNLMAWDN